MGHPITPPPELVQQWRHRWTEGHGEFGVYLATQAARWGADQELEACCAWVQGFRQCGDALRIARRPKPPSLKFRIAEAIAKGDKHQALYLLDEALSDD